MFQPSERAPLRLHALETPAAPQRSRSVWLVRDRAFVFTFTLLATTRLFLFLIARPNGYFANNSDYDFYFSFARLSNLGFYPFVSYWLEYPPLFPWLAVLIYRLSLLLPPMPEEPIFWFRLLLGGVVYLFDLGNLVLIYAMARDAYGRRRAIQVMAVYGALLMPVYTWLAWFDTVPLFFLLAAVWLLMRRRLYLASALAWIGFMVKIVPLLALAAGARLEKTWRRRFWLLVPAGLAIGLLALPFVVVSPRYLIASFASIVYRSSWETVWALLEGYFSFGAVAPLGERFDPASAHYTNHPGWIPFPLVTAAFGAAYYWLWQRQSRQPASRQIILLAGLTVNFYLLASKGYSPQFLVYVLPFLVLALPVWRGLGYATALTFANLVEWPIYHTMFGGAAWVLVVGVLLRTVLLILVSVEYVSLLYGWVWWRRWSQPALRLGATVLLVGSVAFAYLGIQQWIALSYDKDPLSQSFAFIRSHTGVSVPALVFSDDDLYSRFYPFFHQEADLYVFHPQHAAEGEDLLSPELTASARRARLAQILQTHGEVWLVRYADDWTATELNTWLSGTALIVTSDYVVTDRDGKSLSRPVIVQLFRAPSDLVNRPTRLK